MRKFELTEKDIRDLWLLAKAGDHVSDSQLTDLQKKIGFKSGFIENGHGGYWRLSKPRWFNTTTIAKDLITILAGLKVFDCLDRKEFENLKYKFNRLKL